MEKLKFIYIFLVLPIIVTITISIKIADFFKSNDSILRTKSTIVSSTMGPQFSQNNSADIEKNKYTVVLDPGHGGKDSGSIGPKGTQEKDVALAVALKVGEILEKKNIKVIYIRKDDNISWSSKKEELLVRAEISNKNNADIFVSIHANSSEYKNVGGTETYYNPVSSKGKTLASIIQSEIVSEVKLRDRGIKPENFSILRNVEAPSVLIELAYISNTNEESILRSSEYQSKFAQAIASGIIKYFE